MNEREFPSLTSEQKVRHVISSLSLTPSLEYVSPSKAVATCTLRNSMGTIIAEGAGKGDDCHVGALAESVEHYALEHLSARHLTQCSVNKVREQPLTNMEGLFRNLPISDTALECVAMEDIRDKQIAYIPAILQLPTKRWINTCSKTSGLEFLKRYATNSGIAFGCSENEAILHGLNEVIERHTLSKILMSLCGQSDQMPLTLPNTETQTELFSEHTETLSLASRFKILFMLTQQGVYFSIAIPKCPDGRYPICPVGSGCSVDPRIAIRRAVTELIQTIQLYDAEEKNTDLRAYALMNASASLRSLIPLEHLRNVDKTCKRLNPSLNLSLTEQIEHVTQNLNNLGYRVLHRTLAHFDNGCAVTQVYVPGLERFNLVRAGIPVVPQRLLHANASRV